MTDAFEYIVSGSQPGCYIVRLQYVKDGRPASAIALLPTTETVNWKAAVIYNPQQTGPCRVQTQRYPVFAADASWSNVLFIFNNITDTDYLMFGNGARAMVPQHHLKACDQLLHTVKPVFDEFAILTADPPIKAQFKRADFATFGNEFASQIGRSGGDKGLEWRSMGETDQDRSIKDQSLLFAFMDGTMDALDEFQESKGYWALNNDMGRDDESDEGPEVITRTGYGLTSAV